MPDSDPLLWPYLGTSLGSNVSSFVRQVGVCFDCRVDLRGRRVEGAKGRIRGYRWDPLKRHIRLFCRPGYHRGWADCNACVGIHGGLIQKGLLRPGARRKPGQTRGRAESPEVPRKFACAGTAVNRCKLDACIVITRRPTSTVGPQLKVRRSSNDASVS